MSIQSQAHSYMKIKTFFLRNHWPFVTKFHRKEMKINKYEFGHMTTMAAMPYMVKSFKKPSSPEAMDRLP